ncbi:MAG: hypothetical protein CL561_10830 [Alphaproteobacteria bacterium]|nr:hypothetical protein [Alphaproteobacteria bacterium]|tara:strand:- start:1584 stop:2054 length:471 start_codon:yes stop_codon:yes gene_type:complete
MRAMPILLLGAGIILLGVFLVFFQKGSTIDAQKALWRFVLLIIIPLALFYLILLGRSLPALLVLFIVAPLVVKEIKSLRTEGAIAKEDEAIDLTALSKAEAYKILGLEDGASAEDVKSAHARLIKKNHPDQEGNAWLAAKINAARDVLLEKSDKDV